MSSELELANLPDADVVALAKKGREPAFREIIRRYERPVFSLVYRMVGDRETAEDLTTCGGANCRRSACPARHTQSPRTK
jgi:hypothetical protein